MVTFNWNVVIVVLILLVVADKVITVANLNAIKKNFPKIDPLKAEKNPIARFFFTKFGLTWGTLFYGVLSLISILLFMLLVTWTLTAIKTPNALSISLWAVIMLYFLILGNNLYFLLKFSRIIP